MRDGTLSRAQFIDAVEHLCREFKAELEDAREFEASMRGESSPFAKLVCRAHSDVNHLPQCRLIA